MSLPPLKGDKPKKKKKRWGMGIRAVRKRRRGKITKPPPPNKAQFEPLPKRRKRSNIQHLFFSYSLLRDLGRRSECIWPPPFPSYRLIDRIR